MNTNTVTFVAARRMIVFLNGQFVPQEKAVVSVFDRSFLYGDGLFETIRVYHGQPFSWAQHFARLERGAEFLNLRLPFTNSELREVADQLIQRNQMPESLLRISLSRGVGTRGYSPQGADRPFLVMTLHPAPPIDPANPPRWRLVTSSFRVPAGDRLANFKTCNKLPQILARAEAEARGADEALLLNTDGHVAEAASSNLFWIEDGAIYTPPLACGILAGVTRGFVLELCVALGLACGERSIQPEALKASDTVFLTLSSWEVAEVISLDGQTISQSALTKEIFQAYRRAVQREPS